MGETRKRRDKGLQQGFFFFLGGRRGEEQRERILSRLHAQSGA